MTNVITQPSSLGIDKCNIWLCNLLYSKYLPENLPYCDKGQYICAPDPTLLLTVWEFNLLTHQTKPRNYNEFRCTAMSINMTNAATHIVPHTAYCIFPYQPKCRSIPPRKSSFYHILITFNHSNYYRKKSDTATYIGLLYAFFWVIPQHLNFICWRFGTLFLFHLHGWLPTYLFRTQRKFEI